MLFAKWMCWGMEVLVLGRWVGEIEVDYKKPYMEMTMINEAKA